MSEIVSLNKPYEEINQLLEQIPLKQDQLKNEENIKSLNGQPIICGGTILIPEIRYIEGTSNSDAIIESINIPQEEGYENMIISIVYYDNNAGMWSNCVCYKPSGNTQLITGGPKFGVSVVVGGVEAYRVPNAKYRVFYFRQKIA